MPDRSVEPIPVVGSADGDALGFLRPLVPDRSHTTRLARSRFSGRVAEHLREAIIGGDLPAHTALVEMRLAEQLSVSRGPIRNALAVLESEGLVRTLSNGRSVSEGFDSKALRDLFAVRFELESLGLRWGVANHADLNHVHAAIAAIEAEGASTPRLAELDLVFHRSLMEMSGNRFLVQAWLAIAPVIGAVITIGNRRLAAQDPMSNFARIVESHRRLVDALETSGIDAAEAMLADQFRFTESMFVESQDEK
jgi:GntR family transcriptional regulator, gluconate operon transcriptional repressor